MEPTHYIENSSCVIDLIFTSNKNSVLLSGVGNPFRDQDIICYCPVYFVLNFSKSQHLFFVLMPCFRTAEITSRSREIFRKLTGSRSRVESLT